MSLGQLLQRAAQARQSQHHVIELQFRQTGDDQRDQRRKARISPVEWCLIRSVAADLVAQANGLVEQAAVARKSILELSRKVEERQQSATACGCGGHEEGAICNCQEGSERELGEFCCAMLLGSVHFGRLMSFARLACPSLMDDRQRFANVIGAPDGMRAEAYGASFGATAPHGTAATQPDPNASPLEGIFGAMMRYAQGDRSDLTEAELPEAPDEAATRPDAEPPSQDAQPRGRGRK